MIKNFKNYINENYDNSETNELIELINNELPDGYQLKYIVSKRSRDKGETFIELFTPDGEVWCGWNVKDFNIPNILKEIDVVPSDPSLMGDYNIITSSFKKTLN